MTGKWGHTWPRIRRVYTQCQSPVPFIHTLRGRPYCHLTLYMVSPYSQSSGLVEMWPRFLIIQVYGQYGSPYSSLTGKSSFPRVLPNNKIGLQESWVATVLDAVMVAILFVTQLSQKQIPTLSLNIIRISKWLQPRLQNILAHPLQV